MRKVAIYARVSTEHEAQISALENQVQYYDEILAKHPDWELYDRYIDEGVTGTSFNKRENFIRMMEDAQEKLFDLIITREVSRFARNTVDTLQQTRILKSYGVEVWFTEDNIWTMNDEDGELRLSIMATLAQNESKKISTRVKAGQKISFMNGVLYGNGNILGYDRQDKNHFILNKEQSKVVREIFDLYLSGLGARKIKFILEQENRKTAMGKTNWAEGNIMRILKNPFYCGRIEYRKQYVPDYLTQKKINNHGEIEKVVVKGTHPQIITEEEFDRVQEIIKNSCVIKNDKVYGKPLADNVWVRKLKCKCGHSMNRRVNYVSKTTGNKTYTFQCYNQLTTGTINTRMKKGLPIDGICDNKSFPQWKLEIQADFIFRKLISNKQEIYDKAIEMLESGIMIETDSVTSKQHIENNIKEIDKLKQRIDVLLDMCTSGDISIEIFRNKKEIYEKQINDLYEANEKEKNNIKCNESQDDLNKRLEALTEFIKMKAFDKDAPVPETLIEKYVQRITVDKDVFTWELSPGITDTKNLLIDANGVKKNGCVPFKTMCYANGSTGSYQLKTLIKNSVFLGNFRIPKSYMKSKIGYYYSDSGFYFPNEMQIKLFIK